MLIQSRNTLHETAPKTYLQNAEAAGTTVFRMRNTLGFGSSWAIQVGETGEAQTEVLLLNGDPGAGTLGTSTAASRFEHPADTPVYGVKFDQVVFERSTDGTAGTATPMTNGTVTYSPHLYDLEDRASYTVFDDSSGSASYAYRTYFRNSVLAVNSTESDWITPSGFSFYSLASMRERIKDKLWDASWIKDDITIDNWINEWKDEMSNSVIAINEDYAMGTVDVAFDGTDGYGTITTNDFSQIRKIEVTYNGNNWYKSTKMDINDPVPDQIFSSTKPYHAWRGDTVFQVFPNESGGTARVWYYAFGTTMVNDTDELPLPMRPFTKSFIDYGEAQALRKDEKQDWKDKMREAYGSKQDFVTKLTPRDKSGVEYIDLVEPVANDDIIT